MQGAVTLGRPVVGVEAERESKRGRGLIEVSVVVVA